MKSDCGEQNKPILVGGIGKMNFGKQFRQGNRVYDSNGIAMCLLSQPIGNCGGNSYLYAIGAAMRGRYDFNGSISQNLEMNGEEVSNTITTVGKDSLVVVIK